MNYHPMNDLQDGIIEVSNGIGIVVDQTSRIHNSIVLNGDVDVIQSDMYATNGVIHLIDQGTYQRGMILRRRLQV
jgi:Fasciclin domain